MGKQPNIVFIMADQWAASFVGCYGSGVDSTPALDRLAAGGMRFDRCYAHVSVCAPNRATVFTGRSAEIHGVVTNNLYLPAVHPTFPHVLRHAGYRTGAFGKFHFTPMQRPLPANFAHLGFDESVPTEDPKLGPWLDWIAAEHPDHYERALAVSWEMPYASCYGPDGLDLRPRMAEAREKYLAPAAAASSWPCTYTSPLPTELHQTTWITDLSLDFMARHVRDHAARPFVCFTSYVDPHDPYDPPAPYDAIFEAADVPPPIGPPEQRCPSKILAAAKRTMNFHEIAHRTDVVRKLRAMYHGSLRFLDDQIARIVRFLDDRGLRDDTIIVFTTDHGDMMGDHGFITKGVMHYDACIRCPLIVSRPGATAGVTGRLTSSLDFFPTFCDWAGVSDRPPVEGRSFAAACRGDDDAGWPEVTVQAPLGPAGRTVRSIVTNDGWRFSVFNEPGCGQMFDLNADPREQRDLYDQPDHGARRLALHERLTRAYLRAPCVQQYPNLPVEHGRRCLIEHDLVDLSPTCDDGLVP